MKKIEIYEHCFGSGVEIDDRSLFLHEYDNRTEDNIRDLKLSLIQELIKNVDKLSNINLMDIARVVTSLDEWGWIEEESKSYSCDQCGNYNWNEVYKRIEP